MFPVLQLHHIHSEALCYSLTKCHGLSEVTLNLLSFDCVISLSWKALTFLDHLGNVLISFALHHKSLSVNNTSASSDRFVSKFSVVSPLISISFLHALRQNIEDNVK